MSSIPLPGLLPATGVAASAVAPANESEGVARAAPFSLPARLRNLSITRKLAAAVASFLVVIAAMLLMMFVAFNLAAGVRAYVGGEGLWSKGQKDAVYHLSLYARSRNEADYRKFQRTIAIPLGDRTARTQLLRSEFDYAAVEAGFVQGGNAARDVPSMVFVFRHFQQQHDVHRALEIWQEAEIRILELEKLGGELHAAIGAATFSEAQVARTLARIDAINDAVTPLERAFSESMRSAAWSLRVVLRNVILAVTALLVGLGLWLSWCMAADMRRSIHGLEAGVARVARGDLEHHIRLASRDEFGELAAAFNDMIVHRREAGETLAARAVELERSNTELEQFAYVASHDLTAPLRGIRGFVQLLQRRLKGQLDQDSTEYIELALKSVDQMQALTAGLLALCKIGHDRKAPVPTDLNTVLTQALAQLAPVVSEREAQVTIEPLPAVPGTPVELHQLFQNLVGNAIKFQPGVRPHVHVSAQRDGAHWRFSVRDEGIGIEPAHRERIFQLFQRLHPVEAYEGSGIGLAICRKIVHRHGGCIWVESVPGQGSTFKFTLNA